MTDKEKREIAAKIKSSYAAPSIEKDGFNLLVALNKKVNKPPMTVALITGIIGALITGLGMSLIMTDLGDVIGLASALVPGIIIGVLGLLLCAINYPLYKNFLSARKARYADEIIKLSNEVLK